MATMSSTQDEGPAGKRSALDIETSLDGAWRAQRTAGESGCFARRGGGGDGGACAVCATGRRILCAGDGSRRGRARGVGRGGSCAGERLARGVSCGQGFGLDGPCGVPADSAGRARGKGSRGVPADSDRAATALARGNSFRAVIAPRALASARVRARNGRRPRCVSRRRSSLRAYAAARGGMSEPVLARLGVLAQQHHHFEGHRGRRTSAGPDRWPAAPFPAGIPACCGGCRACAPSRRG